MNSLTAQFLNFRRNPTPNENEVDLSMLWLTAKVLILRLNGQSAFYARMAWQKVSFPLRNYVQSSKTWQDLQQLTKFHLVFLYMKSIKKEDLESTIKNYHPKHIIVAQQTMAPICLHKRKTNAEKFRRMINIMTH